MWNVKRSEIFNVSVLAVMLGGCIGCSHLEAKKLPVNANASDEISKLEADETNALSEQLDVKSPKDYRLAQEALNDAKKMRDRGKDSSLVLEYVEQGNAHMARAKENAKIADATLPDVFRARADAIAANAPAVMKKDLVRADDHLKAATEAIEKKDLKEAEEMRGKLQEEYASIELNSIIQDKLGAAKDSREQAVKEGAKKSAPRTYEEATKSYDDAVAYITQNRHDQGGIQERANAARMSAEHLLKVNRDVNVAGKTDNEAQVLALENEKVRANTNAAMLAGESAKLAAEKSTAQSLSAELQATKDRDAANKKFNERLATAQAAFTESEAEVYRDGSSLVIRLKSLEFPVGAAVVPTASYPVLGKVQTVIKDLNASHVVVQGHTDSTGGKVANQKLSEVRANAVRDYLVSNGAIAESKITAVGFGDSKPLANNKTKAGRAQNRRVDVIIEPETLVTSR